MLPIAINRNKHVCATVSINEMYARGTRSFFEQECDQVVLVCINLTLLQRKSCSVHMTVLEIVVHR